MKRILFFFTLFAALGGILNAQTEWTGNGNGFDWDDPFNWSNEEVPQFGDEILIEDAFDVYYSGGNGEIYGSLQLVNSKLYVGGNLYLFGDGTLAVDIDSTLTIDVGSDGRNGGVIFDLFSSQGEDPPTISFNGTLDVAFNGFAPQIGDEFELFEGTQMLCDTPPTIMTSDNSSTGFEVTLESQCVIDESESVLYRVTSINYTTAKQWDGEAGDESWDNGTNWNPDGLPDANSPLIFNLPGAGSYAKTNSTTTTAYNIKVGKNNTLEINGDLSMKSTIYNNREGTIVWNAGEISKSSSTQSLLISYGTINLDGPGLKKIDNGFEIWSFRGVINHNQGGFEINNSKVKLFNDTEYNIGNNVQINSTSGSTLHDLEIGANATVKKENSTGTSSFNLDLENKGKVICETGTLDIIGGLTTGVGFFNGSYRGSGTIGFPTGHVLEGDIYPGSSPGVLTVLDNLTTGVDADFIIEINGPNAGTEYDQVVVTNEAILEGTINVTLGYLPANDASFQIVTAADLTSCNFPAQITTSYNGTPYTFDVACFNNSLYLNGPNATLSATENVLEDIAIYPNPVSSVLNIKSNLITKGHWQLINQLGQVIKASQFEANELKINVTEIPTGLYFFKLDDDSLNATVTKKIIISN